MMPRRNFDCRIEGCPNPAKSLQLCLSHYNRWRRHGDPLGGGLTPGAPLAERLARYTDVREPDECWPWIGPMDSKGYGRLNIGGRGGSSTGAHRLAWEVANGRAIPPGLYVLHVCDNPPCVNPAHLSVGTQQQNLAEMFARGRDGRNGRRRIANRSAGDGDLFAVRVV